jgi:hypothetical protein
MSESSCSASFGVTGWRDRSARHFENVLGYNFPYKVIGSRL